MKSTVAALMCAGAIVFLAVHAAERSSPAALASISLLSAPQDRAYPGEIRLVVNAADVGRRIVHVHETVSGLGAEPVLLYPKWLPGTHAPEGTIDRLAGLTISANGARVSWTRDPVDMFAFRVHTPTGVSSVDVDFDYLSPTSAKVGALEMSPELLMIEWNELVLYPAGYFVRRIPVDARLTLPANWQLGTALEIAATSGSQVSFKRVNLEKFVDSPVYAGRYAERLDLDPGAAAPVHLDLFADRAALLEVKPEQIGAYRSLMQQAYKLFGSRHYAHYDFLYSLSDQIQQNGLEHHQSSENGGEPQEFTEWEQTAAGRDLLAHELIHSWNGKFRRPADLWTPNYNVPMQNSLLWVYEGQTQYWGEVLAARSGLWTLQQALDQLALTAAYFDLETGRQWRSLQDTTNDEIVNPRRPQSWRDWQRFEDYYEVGQLIWLDVDTWIRERSQGKRSLDDFARSFFGIHDGSDLAVTYTLADVVKALNAVEANDWATFLRTRLEAVNKPVPLDGLRRGGYKLVFTDTPSDLLKASDQQHKRVTLLYSIGIEIDDKNQEGSITQVIWGSPAFKANLTEGGQILGVNGAAYSADVLKDAIRSAKGTTVPVELIMRKGDRYVVAQIDYHAGLRYPHLERDNRDNAEPVRLDQILAPRP